jgi:asparagine synthase (glutamine-hydrolysing)
LSGICGLVHLDAAPAEEADLRAMVSLLERRGPEGTRTWLQEATGLGHTLLATTPEATRERLPLQDPGTGCTITADVRLDNRDDLLRRLRLRRGVETGDAQIILASYLRWGERCVERLVGDFAFAIWDPRSHTLFCARDHLGVRPFHYHHAPGRLVAFASEARAVLSLPVVPFRIDEGRIADYLIDLEGVDQTSTFFEDVHRLPPAHTLTATPDHLLIRRYWRLEAGDELRLGSDDEYADAFLEVFSTAVGSRLRGAPRVGAMLSGGMDSGSVAAIASSLLHSSQLGPLRTFSAISPDALACKETRTIHAAMRMEGIAPRTISYEQLSEFTDLPRRAWELDEPFDAYMTLLRVCYIAGREAGVNAVLDGGNGDVAFGHADHLTRLLRAGRLLTAYREAAGQDRFWGGTYPPTRQLLRGMRSAVAPLVLRRLWASRRPDRALQRALRDSPIRPEFARHVDLGERIARTVPAPASRSRSFAEQRVRTLEHPHLAAAVERYDRVASAVGVEPRDPFRDPRLLAFAVRLPGEQLLSDGWAKAIMRRSLRGKLPSEVRYRTGKEHLGWAFTKQVAPAEEASTRLQDCAELLAPYAEVDKVRQLDDPLERQIMTYSLAQLGSWLSRHELRCPT